MGRWTLEELKPHLDNIRANWRNFGAMDLGPKNTEERLKIKRELEDAKKAWVDSDEGECVEQVERD